MLPRLTKNIILLTLLLSLIGFASANAASFEWRDVQYRLDRIYFPVGHENWIYSDCRFWVIDNCDTLITGSIEVSATGISYSYPLGDSLLALIPDAALVKIETVAINFHSEIVIGLVDSMLESYLKLPNGSQAIVPDTGGMIATPAAAPVRIVILRTQHELADAYDRGVVDGVLSYRMIGAARPGASTMSFGAPFYAALLPSPSAEINRSAFLTTALYYRYQPDNLPMIFEGDKASEWNCLYPARTDCDRAYSHNPSRSRRLLRNVSRKSKLGISYSSPSLRLPATYFADVLGRERFRVELTDKDADLKLSYVPINLVEPCQSMLHIIDLLMSQSDDNNYFMEPLAIASNYIGEARSCTDSTLATQYLKRAAAVLTEDVGVFPLFRPTLHFAINDDILGIAVNTSGILDLSRLYRITLPGTGSEDAK